MLTMSVRETEEATHKSTKRASAERPDRSNGLNKWNELLASHLLCGSDLCIDHEKIAGATVVATSTISVRHMPSHDAVAR